MAYTHQMTTSVGLHVNPLVANSRHGGRPGLSEHGSGRSKPRKPCRNQWRCCFSLLYFSAPRTERPDSCWPASSNGRDPKLRDHAIPSRRVRRFRRGGTVRSRR